MFFYYDEIHMIYWSYEYKYILNVLLISVGQYQLVKTLTCFLDMNPTEYVWKLRKYPEDILRKIILFRFFFNFYFLSNLFGMQTRENNSNKIELGGDIASQYYKLLNFP